MIVHTTIESFSQAFQQLLGNKLRSFLSLLGITIGIICVIAVFSAVDSLEANIRGSFQKLGDDVLYISKMPWGEDPDENFWKYERRPTPSYADYEAIREHVPSAKVASYYQFIGPRILQFESNSVSNVFMISSTYEYAQLFSLEIEKGRYFSPIEHQNASEQVLIGFDVAEKLFPPGVDPVGKKVKINGRKMQVVGVIKKSGKDLINPLNYDNVALIPYSTSRKFVNTKSQIFGASVSVKAKEGYDLKLLEDEIIAALRAKRKLKPREDDTFSLNSLSIISNAFDAFFGVLHMVGLIIGGFSILVGMFGVANIMFVSVKERTNLIGIKKAIGARSYVILLEFLIESVVLCLVGGVLGLIIVYLLTKGISSVIEFNIFLSSYNIILGLTIAVITGVIAGFIPAIRASRLNPVDAIRSK
jgi:putative ABC transport system permease protein